MKCDLKTPCDNCPFRKDVKPYITYERADEIIRQVCYGDKSFSCHKTTQFDYEGEYITHKDEQMCAGAMILLERIERPNQMMRICERIGLYDRHKLNMEAPVFEDEEEMYKHFDT